MGKNDFFKETLNLNLSSAQKDLEKSLCDLQLQRQRIPVILETKFADYQREHPEETPEKIAKDKIELLNKYNRLIDEKIIELAETNGRMKFICEYCQTIN